MVDYSTMNKRTEELLAKMCIRDRISFVCKDPAMDFFKQRQFDVGDTVRTHLAAVLNEAEAAFASPLNDPLTNCLIRRENAPFGADGMIGSHLEQMLISLIRQDQALHQESKPLSLIHISSTALSKQREPGRPRRKESR